jgi:hypothetical protein
MPELLEVGGYNTGNGSLDRVTQDYSNIVNRIGLKVTGICEAGDRSRELERTDKLPDVRILRAAKGAPNRLGLILSDIDDARVEDWGYFPLNPGHEDIERTVAGGADGTAEPKFIVWVVIDGVMIGMTHFIPSTAVRTRVTRRWKHPDARLVYAVQVARTVEWFKSGGDVLLGDMNGTPDYDMLRPIRQVAKCYAPDSRKKPRRIDHMYVRHESDVQVVPGTVLAVDDGLSSDHPLVKASLILPAQSTLKPANIRAAEIIERRAESVPRQDVRAELLAAAAETRGL